MPASTGRYSDRVDCTHPVMTHIVSLRLTSSFLKWLFWHHTGAAHSVALYTIASALVQKVGVFVFHNILARHLNKWLHVDVLAHHFSRCLQ